MLMTPTMPVPPTIASGAIQKLIGSLAQRELDVVEVCASIGVTTDVANDPDARLPIALLHDLWEAVLARRPRADLALEIAVKYDLGDYGLVGFVCASAPTFGDALGHLLRYSRLWTDAPWFELTAPGVVELRYQPPFSDRPGLRLANEAALAELMHAARMLTGRPDLRPHAVDISHAAFGDPAAHARYFGIVPTFGAVRDALAFAVDTLSIELPRTDRQLAAFLAQLASDALARRDVSELLAEVRRCIAEALPTGVPDIANIARRMATSESILRSRLDEQGAKFRELLDATRAELAQSYVRDRRLPLGEVAFLLGYAEVSAFHRAFKRWTGQTPTTWRMHAQ